MTKDTQQIIISGLGGQGVLFVTKVLADAALAMGYSVLISETHGMAQRGGNVISHLKVSPMEEGRSFISPLIRPGRADIFLGLHSEAMPVHGHYLRSDGEAFCNSRDLSGASNNVDATAIAFGLNSPVSANLVLLGFSAASGVLFCDAARIESVIESYGGRRLEASLRAFRAGCGAVSGSTGFN